MHTIAILINLFLIVVMTLNFGNYTEKIIIMFIILLRYNVSGSCISYYYCAVLKTFFRKIIGVVQICQTQKGSRKKFMRAKSKRPM